MNNSRGPITKFIVALLGAIVMVPLLPLWIPALGFAIGWLVYKTVAEIVQSAINLIGIDNVSSHQFPVIFAIFAIIIGCIQAGIQIANMNLENEEE